jgi:hypothetical protein
VRFGAQAVAAAAVPVAPSPALVGTLAIQMGDAYQGMTQAVRVGTV